MSLFSSVLSSSSKSKSSSGTKQQKALINDVAINADSLLAKNPTAAGAKYFTPLAQTADETAAYSALRSGFTPTADSLSSDIALQTNPFDESVINTINRQGQGQFSVLNQALNGSGQLGSNRALLGANDIDLSRLDQIGTFKQSEYNTALQNALTTLPALRQNDANNLLTIGANQRALDLETKQAPISALNAAAGIASSTPLGIKSSTSGTQTGSIASALGGGVSGLSTLGGIGGIAHSISGLGLANTLGLNSSLSGGAIKLASGGGIY